MYPSKILVFGEYSILLNSNALAIPYGRFKGDWAFMKDESDNTSKAIESNRSLSLFLKYYRLLDERLRLDVNRFEKDVENGLYFKSDIPMGAGLGSSGALVAAIFDRYVKNSVESTDVLSLKQHLAHLESIFHGTSSGIDPLVSYLNSPIHVKGNNPLERISIPINEILRRRGLFLVNCGNKVKTSDLVTYFNHRCSLDNEYLDRLKNQYIPLNNDCIKEILKEGDEKYFYSLVHELSRLQLVLFEKMILKDIVIHMNYGIERNLFYLKLCGSGGGYFLGFSDNIVETKHHFEKAGYNILIF
ncbi:MAG: mevalonate kinase [Bacteroidales bacterium]|nr:MAG: mevalonate kinase [Bacteroidales bacterium]